jgi:glutamate synthase (ferredoxin)
MISRHAELTGSTRAAEVLAAWDQSLAKFVKVLPKDYKRVLMAMDRVIASGLSGDEAVMAAFEENARDLARVGGN